MRNVIVVYDRYYLDFQRSSRGEDLFIGPPLARDCCISNRERCSVLFIHF